MSRASDGKWALNLQRMMMKTFWLMVAILA